MTTISLNPNAYGIRSEYVWSSNTRYIGMIDVAFACFHSVPVALESY
jgi:hypothetical protein